MIRVMTPINTPDITLCAPDRALILDLPYPPNAGRAPNNEMTIFMNPKATSSLL